MANASLAAKYRPQNFEQVVGQDMVKSILSNACAQDKIAPAYLLSGTRGVGKTTVARVFAKTLNCRQAPTAEPCNTCDACLRITQGSFVDVVEIDGASNGGVDDVRRLRESVAYAPLEGRYKVIIIDEAHMLSKSAFNALLKTLEEPPSHVVFLLATTEQHKIPSTILSRCQQFIFRQVPEQILEKHLTNVLEKENRPFETQAVKLLAGRAVGSVRDGMSLLGQVLAFLPDPDTNLSATKVREVLGLAGTELLESLLTALKQQDALSVCKIIDEILEQGVDMTFFLKELTTLWRNLFVLQQAGPSALPDISPDDLTRLTAHTQNFSSTYIHAAWQMTLDNQRRILQSLEPAAGLELLLLNLTFLPRLLPISDLQMTANCDAVPQNQGATKPPFPDGLLVIPETINDPKPSASSKSTIEYTQEIINPMLNITGNTTIEATVNATVNASIGTINEIPPAFDETKKAVAEETFSGGLSVEKTSTKEVSTEEVFNDEVFNEEIFADEIFADEISTEELSVEKITLDKTWNDFYLHCEENNILTDLLPFLFQCEGELKTPLTSLEVPVEYVRNLLVTPNRYQMIKQSLDSYLGFPVEITFTIAEFKPISLTQLEEYPLIQKLKQEFNSNILECWKLNTKKGANP